MAEEAWNPEAKVAVAVERCLVEIDRQLTRRFMVFEEDLPRVSLVLLRLPLAGWGPWLERYFLTQTGGLVTWLAAFVRKELDGCFGPVPDDTGPDIELVFPGYLLEPLLLQAHEKKITGATGTILRLVNEMAWEQALGEAGHFLGHALAGEVLPVLVPDRRLEECLAGFWQACRHENHRLLRDRIVTVFYTLLEEFMAEAGIASHSAVSYSQA